MAGFGAGFGQGFSSLPQMVNSRADREQELQFKQIGLQRQKAIDDTKATGDIIASLNTALETTPEEAIPNRLGLFFSQLEATTGKKINSAVKSEFMRDPAGAVKSMAQLYGETGGFDQNKLGEVLSNPQAFAGVYDALNRRQAAAKTAAAFSAGATGKGATGPTDIAKIDQEIAMLNQAATAPGIGKEQFGFLEKRMGVLADQRKFAIENATMAAARRNGVQDISQASPAVQQAIRADVIRDLGLTEQAQTAGRFSATPLPLDAAQAIQQPFGTTYGDLQGQVASGAQQGTPAASGAPPVAPANAPLGIRNNNPGNLRPVGASTGFQKFETMQEGLAALDKDLQIKGGRGVNTVRKVISAWAPPSENNTEAYIKTVAQRLGVPPDAALDMENPLVRQALSTAISLHENGSKVLLAQNQGRGGRGGAAAPSLVPPTAARQSQDKILADDTAKQFLEWQKAGTKAASKQAKMEQLGSFLDKVDTGTLAGTTLALQKYAEAAGFQVPKSASYAEAAKALAIPMALEMRDPSEGGGLPGAMSNYEDQLLQSAIPNLDKLPGTNKILVKAYIANQKRTQEITKLMREYRKENGVIDDGIFAVVQDYKEKNPIFSAADAAALQGDKKSKAATPAVGPFEDKGKEDRYQAWKKSQGK